MFAFRSNDENIRRDYELRSGSFYWKQQKHRPIRPVVTSPTHFSFLHYFCCRRNAISGRCIIGGGTRGTRPRWVLSALPPLAVRRRVPAVFLVFPEELRETGQRLYGRSSKRFPQRVRYPRPHTAPPFTPQFVRAHMPTWRVCVSAAACRVESFSRRARATACFCAMFFWGTRTRTTTTKCWSLPRSNNKFTSCFVTYFYDALTARVRLFRLSPPFFALRSPPRGS